MNTMSSDDQARASLWLYEQKYHKDVFDWLIGKLPAKDGLEVLDISADACTFTNLLGERLKPTKIVTALRENSFLPCSDKVATVSIDINSLSKLAELGKFDLIILKDVTHEIADLKDFLVAIKANFRDDKSRLFLMDRPKNPPLPVPDPAMDVYKKYAIVRESIIELALEANFKEDCYACCAPIKVDSREWHNILKGRFFPAVKEAKKCTDGEIRDFVNRKGRFVQFEEKIFIFVLWLPSSDELAEMEKDRAEAKAAEEAEDQPKLTIKTI